MRAVHRAAYRPAGADPRVEVVEARLTDALRDDVGFLTHLSLVAVLGGDVVGHVIATRGWLEPLGVPALRATTGHPDFLTTDVSVQASDASASL